MDCPIFLKESHLKPNKNKWMPIQIFILDTYETHQCLLLINDTEHVLIKLRSNSQKQYQLDLKTKMEPIYSQQNLNKPYLRQIKLHLENQQIALKSQKNDILQQIYDYLKRMISNKGFSQYFRPIRRLGKGAFATVYLIQNKLTKLQYAAKVFSRQGQKLEFKGKEALQNQIRMLKFLKHPNIIKYQGLYETQNLIYLVTQYLSGGTLQDCMKDKCNITGELTSQIIQDTLTALSYLEANHVMHRDLKPENIILRSEDNKWVLADFGLSAFSSENYLYDKCGTMGYIAPQIMAQNTSENSVNQHYNSACDLYSLGIIMYQLTVGCLPFRVQGQGIFQKKIVWNAFKSDECKLIPLQLRSIIQGLLQNDPKKRLTPQQALKSSIFTNQNVKKNWQAFAKKKIDDRYSKILQLANIN